MELSFVFKFKLQESLRIILANKIKNEILGEKMPFFDQKTNFGICNLSNFSLDTDNSHIMGHFGTHSCM